MQIFSAIFKSPVMLAAPKSNTLLMNILSSIRIILTISRNRSRISLQMLTKYLRQTPIDNKYSYSPSKTPTSHN